MSATMPGTYSLEESAATIPEERKSDWAWLAPLDPGAHLAAIADRDGVDALKNRCPITLAVRLRPGTDLTDNKSLLDSCVELMPTADPTFVALMELVGADRTGLRSWTLSGLNDREGHIADESRLEALAEVLPSAFVYPRDMHEKGEKYGYRRGTRITCKRRHIEQVQTLMFDSSAGDRCQTKSRTVSVGNSYPLSASHMAGTWPAPYLPLYGDVYDDAALLMSNAMGRLYMTLVTNRSSRDGRAGLPLDLEMPGLGDLHRLQLSGVREPLACDPALALAILDRARDRSWTITETEPGQVAAMRQVVESSVSALAVSGSPNLTTLSVGREHLSALDSIPSGERVQELPSGPGCSRVLVSARAAAKVIAAARRLGSVLAVDFAVADMVAISDAEPIDDERLDPYQREAAGRYAASHIGVVNASAVGSGKTVMTLCGIAECAKIEVPDHAQTRALAVMSKSLRGQWADEADVWTPDLVVVKPTKADLDNPDFLRGVFADAGERPVMCLVTYEVARAHASALADAGFGHLAVDEGAFLGNANSVLSSAMWTIRSGVARATVLTGTPIRKSVDDLGAIAAFVRNDHKMFHGKRISARFDVLTDEGLRDMWWHLGAVVIRYDQSELAHLLPKLEHETVTVDLSAEEERLADGARRHLKDVFRDMDRSLREREASEHNPVLRDLLREERQRLQGASLGGITVARTAALDPVAVEESHSAAAARLRADGFVKPAVECGPTKRFVTAAWIAKRVQGGHPTLTFCEFANTAARLAGDIAAYGVRTRVFAGGMSESARTKTIAEFMGTPCREHRYTGIGQASCAHCVAPTIDSLVLTSVGDEGLNLFRADTVVHFDVSWTPGPIVQRIGRLLRRGNPHDYVLSVFFVAARTIESKVCGRTVRRAIEIARALDASRGVSLADTEMAAAVGSLHEAVDEADGEITSPRQIELARELCGAASA